MPSLKDMAHLPNDLTPLGTLRREKEKEKTNTTDERNVFGREHLHRINNKLVYTPPEPLDESQTAQQTTQTQQQPQRAIGGDQYFRLVIALGNKLGYGSDDLKLVMEGVNELSTDPQWTVHVPGDPVPQCGAADLVVLDRMMSNRHFLGTRAAISTQCLNPLCFGEFPVNLVTVLFYRKASKDPLPVFNRCL